ncbi:MAG: hypothetical protein LUH20_06230, partial [Lachnospiraceae bacterium]|nr:hypothetical protein [Lachnospiraceae bacterium]
AFLVVSATTIPTVDLRRHRLTNPCNIRYFCVYWFSEALVKPGTMCAAALCLRNNLRENN